MYPLLFTGVTFLGNSQACHGKGISIPIPTGFLWKSHPHGYGDSHTHGNPGNSAKGKSANGVIKTANILKVAN